MAKFSGPPPLSVSQSFHMISAKESKRTSPLALLNIVTIFMAKDQRVAEPEDNSYFADATQVKASSAALFLGVWPELKWLWRGQWGGD